MENEPEIVQIKLDETRQQQTTTVIKARQIKLSNNKTVIAYNHINGYILDALMKVVFNDTHWPYVNLEKKCKVSLISGWCAVLV